MRSSSEAYAHLPHEPTIPIERFHAAVPPTDVDDLHALLRQGVKRPPKETYENTTSKLNLGVTRDWMIETSH